MVDVTDLSRPGNNLVGGSDPFELFLKKFSGEVANAYEIATVMLPNSRVRTISKGKSAQFPATGRATSAYHVAGKDILDTANSELGVFESGERIILVDRTLLSALFIDELEDMINHYDVRGPMAEEMGFALARQADTQLLQLVAKGALSTSGAVADQGGGTDLSGTDIPELAAAGTDGSALVEGFRRMAQSFDEKNVPKSDRVAVLAPAQFYLATQQTDFINIELNNGSNGSQKDGDIARIYGFKIMESNQVPSTDTSGAAAPSHTVGTLNDYRVDARNNVGLFFQKGAVGTVQLRGVTTEMEYSIRHQGDLMVAKVAQGHGVLREEACGILRTADPV